MDYYDLLLGGNYEPNRMAEAARQLRRQQAYGTLGQLTGDPMMGAVGGGMVESAGARAEGLRKARQATTTARALGEGYYEQAGEIQRVPGWSEAQERKHQRALEKAVEAAKARAEVNAEIFKQQERWRLEQPTRSQATEARRTAAYLPEFMDLAAELKKVGEIPTIPEASANVARKMPLLGEETAAGLERKGMTPEQVDWLARGRKSEQDIIRLASGLAVTGFELENVKKWSPWASGLTNRERTKRMQNIYNALGRESAAIMNQPWENVEFETTATVETPEGTVELETAGGEWRLPEGWSVRKK